MLNYSSIAKTDPVLSKLIREENRYQQTTLNLIASENYPSQAVRQALSSVFVVKYSEGRPRNRYYGGMENIDQLEELAQERILKLFLGKDKKGWAINIQPLSGSPANYAILRGLLKPGDKIMSLALSHGGHLSHGAAVSLSGQDFRVINYFLNKETELLDYKSIRALALKERPKLIICGFSSFPRIIDFKKFREIADTVGSYLLADIAHIAGLIAGKVHPSPFPWADVVMTTTHKTLRGPRGAVIICRERIKDKIFPKVFPGLQGGPHNHTIAALAVAFREAAAPSFVSYAKQVVKNAKILAKELQRYNFRLVSNGTDTHLILIDLTNNRVTGLEAQRLLEKSRIIVNKNMIPYDKRSPYDPSGIRLGTPALTTRGMKEKEMKLIASWINEVINNPGKIDEVGKRVKTFCKTWPLF